MPQPVLLQLLSHPVNLSVRRALDTVADTVADTVQVSVTVCEPESVCSSTSVSLLQTLFKFTHCYNSV